MKTIFLTVYDGDTEKVILRSGVFSMLVESGHRIILLVRGDDRLEYYRREFAQENVIVELLPKAMTALEMLWYHLGWNTLPTRAAYLRRRMKLEKHKNRARYALESLAGFLGNFRFWRTLLRFLYALAPDSYCKEYFDRYTPDLVFTPNMFSAEDLRLLRAAKRRRIATVATAKSWDVLTTKAFTRVKADRLLVFNPVNKEEAITIGDYAPEQVVVTGFPQFDVYARDEWKLSREMFCERLGLDPARRILLMAVPGDWKTPYTREILRALDEAIEKGVIAYPAQVLARLHPKYPDCSEGETYSHIVMDRPGTHFSTGREFSPDMGITNVFQWTFTGGDIAHLANSLYHSDLVINTESTLTLDGAALGKPSVLIGYDGTHTLPYWQSVARVYEREHFAHVVATGACPLVTSDAELIDALNLFLANPQARQKERAVLTEKLLYKTDGHSARRTAEAILSLLP